MGPAAGARRRAPGLTLEKDGDAYAGETTLRATPINADLIIALGNPPDRQAVVEKRVGHAPTLEEIEAADAATTRPDDAPQYFFAVHDLPAPEPQKDSRPALKAEHVGVYWDVSLSRAEANKEHELALLARVLAKVGATDVDLIPFSNVPQPTQSFHLTNGDVSPVVGKINALVYDGGTNLSLLSMPATTRDHGGYGLCLLFTDGLANLGEPMPHQLDTPVYTFTNDAHADHALLRRIAAESGGAAFNLLRSTDDEILLAFASAEPWSLLSVEAAGGEVADVYPKGRQTVAGRVAVTGRLLSPRAKVVLHYGYGTTPVEAVEYTLTQDGATSTGLVPRLWGQMKIADLSAVPDANADALAAVGREFNLVTPNTSLLVLETVGQYLAYRIVPPQGRADVYAAFVREVKRQAAAKKQTANERLAAVAAEWNDRVQWWEKKAEYLPNFKWTEPASPAAAPSMPPGGEGGEGPFLHLNARATGAGDGRPRTTARGGDERRAVPACARRLLRNGGRTAA